MAVKGIWKQSCKNILKKWQENIVLEKSCKNIHVPPPIGAGSLWKNITPGGAEIFILRILTPDQLIACQYFYFLSDMIPELGMVKLLTKKGKVKVKRMLLILLLESPRSFVRSSVGDKISAPTDWWWLCVGSHGLSAWRARRTKSRGLKGLQLDF